MSASSSRTGCRGSKPCGGRSSRSRSCGVAPGPGAGASPTPGRTRETPLGFFRDDDRLVVIGSNWGQEHDPAWALNLVANPTARVQIGREHRDIVARVTEGEERGRLWQRLNEAWPAYDTYAERSGRQIKIFVLEPA